VTPSQSSFPASQDLAVNIAINGGTGNPTPTGSVRLTAGTYTSVYTALSGGTATITIPGGQLATGTLTISVTYSGDTNYNGAIGTAPVTVGPAAGFSLSCSPCSI